MVPTTAVTVVEHDEKLAVVDPLATIPSRLHGLRRPSPRPGRKHGPPGLTFIHPERFEAPGAAAPTFVAFVSSIIESGTPPEAMDAVRGRLADLELPPYDCLTPR